MGQQTIEELLFAVQHGPPGPSKNHLCAMDQAEHRQHSKISIDSFTTIS